MKKLVILLSLISSISMADNFGIDYSVAPGSMPQYGADLTTNIDFFYLDFGVVTNKQTTSPSLSGGLQFEVVNMGIVTAANISNSDRSIYGLAGVELGFTENIGKLFYVKANNTLLKDVDCRLNYGLGLSAGVNF